MTPEKMPAYTYKTLLIFIQTFLLLVCEVNLSLKLSVHLLQSDGFFDVLVHHILTEPLPPAIQAQKAGVVHLAVIRAEEG